jgi:uncharacterized membrane protein HdeD (DUF308 family)
LFLMYMGIEEMAYAIDLARLHVKNWWIDLIYSIISLGLGIAILIVEYSGGNSIAMVVTMAGICLIVEGAFELILIFALHRDFKRASKFIDIH